MKLITSSDNEIYKFILRLKEKKTRDQEGKYIIEGPNLFQEAMKNGVDIERVICSEGFEEEKLPERTLFMSDKLFRKLSDTQSPQGIMAIVKKRVYKEEDFFARKKGKSNNIVVLDRLQDPGNIGSILRTADAAGYMGAIIMKGSGDIYAPKVVRAATGSLFRLPVFMIDRADQAINLLESYNKKILCTSLDSRNYYYDVDMKEDVALIIGNEGNGVCQDFLIKSHLQVKIPMMGDVESLNAAVSAGIIMYESLRQIANE